MRKTSNSIIQQLQIVFSFSILLLFFSLLASYYSIQKLISNSRLVNHTNEVLIQAENIISLLKDAETGQRGYLVTGDREFLEHYNGSYANVTKSFNDLSDLTGDNPVQQKNLREIKSLYEAKFGQMQSTIDITTKTGIDQVDREQRLKQMKRGKKLMDQIRILIDHVKAEENNILTERLAQQQIYITFTPIILVFAALISLLISVFAYLRIKKDMDKRILQQMQEEAKYLETNRRITAIEGVTKQVSSGNYTARSTDSGEGELGKISLALNNMTASLETTFNELNHKAWIQTGEMRVADAMRGERILKNLSVRLIETITDYIQAPLGTIYIIDSEYNFKLYASYGARQVPETIEVGKGMTGQAIMSQKKIVLHDLPETYFNIQSSLGHVSPATVVIMPLVFGHECIGVIEIGMLGRPTAQQMEFLDASIESISIGVNGALDYVKLQNFLEETQTQSEELQAQHNELENLNAELEAQTQKLQASEEELRVQQEELRQTNEELEERSSLLEEKNLEIQKKAAELELTTRYKSEFLANMSHELRTPLNSILLLSRLLSDNDEKNLTDDQVEYATVIQSSGNGLLGLIDEILDLSKIEAGKMDLEYETVSITDITEDLRSLFNPVAKQKGLQFNIEISRDTPPVIESDKMRLEQILKNLISNALKFTSQGSVTLSVSHANGSASMIVFDVKDTGIGISPDKQHLIFEAFQQADGSTKRKYGGTGLGLSISRELVKLLGGEISVTSKSDEGSVFTITIPTSRHGAENHPYQTNPFASIAPEVVAELSHQSEYQFISPNIPESIPDDRANILPTDKALLIIEDDVTFAKSLLAYTHKKGYKALVAVRGDEGLELAVEFKPTGILLDIELPVKSGWQVMDELKQNPITRHIPVHMMSSHKMKNESLLKGAIDFIDKPVALDKMKEIFEKIEYVVSRKSKKVLIVEDNSKHAKALAYYLGTFNINSELKTNISEGLQTLKDNEVDCVILDMGIPDKKAYETLEEAKKNPEFENIPIIIFTGKSLSMSEEQRIKQYASTIIVKTAHSYQRMLDEVSLFLHMVEENTKPNMRDTSFKKLDGLTQILSNKTVLVADDDVRNIFSLSKSLENYKMNIITALDGKEALAKLYENPAIDVVLLDMMMPKMDGYETATRIRENPSWKNLPVIAVTAKAMTGDREKCINAGASDYITKPVDVDQLLSLLRVWLYERY
ncbi:response regulator [Dyadobacter sp. 32]|uniref:response regulator n=1 Tax=Dyadobacter sp. 32 TaxID=538966 RepID=UPI0011ECE330